MQKSLTGNRIYKMSVLYRRIPCIELAKNGAVAKPVCQKCILMVFFVRSERRLQRLRKGVGIKKQPLPKRIFLFLLRNHPVITKNASVHSVNSVHSVRKCFFRIFRFCNNPIFLFQSVPFFRSGWIPALSSSLQWRVQKEALSFYPLLRSL